MDDKDILKCCLIEEKCKDIPSLEEAASIDYLIKLDNGISQEHIKQELQEHESNENGYGIKIEGKLEVNTEAKEHYEMVCVASNVKREVSMSDQYNYCENCKKEYDMYCLKCPMLCHILDNSIPCEERNKARSTIPKYILEIQQLSNSAEGVFSLKTIPTGVNFGPHRGLAKIVKSTAYAWKVEDGKFLSAESANCLNWMQYVNCTQSSIDHNLVIFQCNGDLFYRTTKQIDIGEELLIHHEDCITNINYQIEKYYCPVVEEMRDVYACTFCCLGFSSEVYLKTHRINCPYQFHHGHLEELIQCSSCKIHLDKEEYFKFHMNYCQKKETGPSEPPTEAVQIQRVHPVNKNFACTKCVYRTSSPYKYNKHFYTHVKPFNCSICGKGFSTKFYRKRHIRLCRQEKLKPKTLLKKKTGEIVGVFQCNVCSRHLSSRQLLKKHYLVHKEVELLECPECDFKCRHKEYLNAHCRNKHTSGDKRFKCLKCKYQTNHKTCLISHFYTHGGVKPFECKVCDKRFADNGSLRKHTYTHSEEKLFRCAQCERKYASRKYLNKHVKDKHDSNNVKQFKCATCPYETNYKSNYNSHLSTHENKKPFACDICSKRFRQKAHLKTHGYTHSDQKLFRCYVCGKEFRRKEHLKRHSTIHSNDKPHGCDLCEKKFARRETLKTHYRIHTGEKRFECLCCEYKCNHKVSINLHMKSKHGIDNGDDLFRFERFAYPSEPPTEAVQIQRVHPVNKNFACTKCVYRTSSPYKYNKHFYTHVKPFNCSICGKGFSTKFYRKRHIRLCRQEKLKPKTLLKKKTGEIVGVFQCNVCSRHLSSRQLLKKHYLVHKEVELLECPECDFKCRHKEYLNAHCRNKHTSGDKRFKCLKCKYQTNHKTCLISHFYTHGGVKPFECKVCDKRFADNGSLRKHTYTHSEEKLFRCAQCERKYASRKYLNKHVKDKHDSNNVKQFKCATCPYETNYKSNYNSHLSTHENKKPFACDICSKRFRQKAHLKTHGYTHSDQKLFRCYVCGKEFRRKEHLKRHSTIHSNDKPHGCDLCEKKFARRETLKTHYRIHTGEKRFECLCCEYKCNHKVSINLHMKSKHGIDNGDDLFRFERFA